MSYLEMWDDHTLALKCNFEDRERVKSVGDYKWNSLEKKWIFPFRRDIVDIIRSEFPTLAIASDVLKAYSQDEKFQEKVQSIKKLKDCQVNESFLKLPLFTHQRVGVKFLTQFRKAACFDDMGLGKTLEALCFAVNKKEKIRKCLILCPKSVKLSVWADQIEEFTYEKYVVVDGPKKKREEQFQEFKNNDIFFLIASYETFRVAYDRLKTLKLINSNSSGINMMILDEATKIKNPQTQITKKVIKTQIDFALILTGTPMWNRVEDIYMLIQFIHPGLLGSTYWSFSDKYLRKGGFENHDVIGYKNLDDLQEKVNSISIRREKHEVVQLPDMIREDRTLDMEDKEQREAYRTMQEEMIVWVKTLDDQEIKVKAGELLTRNLRLSQITDGFLTDYSLKITKWYKGSSKLKEIKTIIKDYAESHQIVIFTRWLPMVDILQKTWEKSPYNAVSLYGRLNDTKRAEAISSFQSGRSRIFVAQINTGGMGIDLSCATIQIYIDKAFISPAVLNQAEDRSHRPGLKNSLEVISLICKNTIDEHWEKLMRRKQRDISKFFPRTMISRADWLYLLGTKK